MLKVIKSIVQFFQITILFIAFLLAGIFFASKYNLITPISFYMVMSGSMEPQIHTGSIVIVRPKILGYKIGDPITFKSSGKQTTTHRVFAIETENDQILYRTKGDANQDPDTNLVPQTNVIGQVLFSIPFVGYAIELAKKPQGFILLVIVPATILVYEELRTLKIEISKIFFKNSKIDNSLKIKNLKLKINPSAPLPPLKFVSKPKAQKIPAYYLIIPIFLSLPIFLSVTYALYNDHEVSKANVLGAASSYGPTLTPTPRLTLTPSPSVEPTPLLIETLTLDSANPSGINSSNVLVIGNNYRLEISGTFSNRGGVDTIDADYNSYDSFATPGTDGDPNWTVFGLTNFADLLDTQVDSLFVNWGVYQPSHVYTLDLPGTGNPVNLRVFDGVPETNTQNPSWYLDNSGALTIKIYQI